MVKIYNKNLDWDIPRDAVYVGRGSPFGNPFVMGSDGNRLKVIQKFEKWLEKQPELVSKMKEELNGKDLVCYCFPYYCHAEIISRIVN